MAGRTRPAEDGFDLVRFTGQRRAMLARITAACSGMKQVGEDVADLRGEAVDAEKLVVVGLVEGDQRYSVSKTQIGAVSDWTMFRTGSRSAVREARLWLASRWKPIRSANILNMPRWQACSAWRAWGRWRRACRRTCRRAARWHRDVALKSVAGGRVVAAEAGSSATWSITTAVLLCRISWQMVVSRLNSPPGLRAEGDVILDGAGDPAVIGDARDGSEPHSGGLAHTSRIVGTAAMLSTATTSVRKP